MANDLPPSGTIFISRPHTVAERVLLWALSDKDNGQTLTEYRNTKAAAKAEYAEKYGTSGHKPKGSV